MKLLEFKYNYSNVIKLALFSRVFYLTLGWISSLLLQRFDKSTNLYPSNSPFKYLMSWDAIHFYNIAKEGYSYEHSIAFFPLLPLLTKLLPFLDILTAGIILNNFFFILSSMLLYKISLKKYSARIAFNSTIFFNFNPASVIFSSFYTESLFCFLFLIAFYYIQTKKFFKASIILAFSSLTRSNTLVFLIFFKTIHFPIIVIPIVILQLKHFLKNFDYHSSFKFIIPYTMVQKKYWDQGFMRFIRFKNVPNMFFGIIPIIHSLYIIKLYIDILYIRYFKNNIDNVEIKKYSRFFFIKFLQDPFVINLTSETTKLFLILGLQIFGLIFFMHWNMAYRFISYNPILYWSLAYLQLYHHKNNRFRFVLLYHFIYSVIYTILFSTYYPPA